MGWDAASMINNALLWNNNIPENKPAEIKAEQIKPEDLKISPNNPNTHPNQYQVKEIQNQAYADKGQRLFEMQGPNGEKNFAATTSSGLKEYNSSTKQWELAKPEAQAAVKGFQEKEFQGKYSGLKDVSNDPAYRGYTGGNSAASKYFADDKGNHHLYQDKNGKFHEHVNGKWQAVSNPLAQNVLTKQLGNNTGNLKTEGTDKKSLEENYQKAFGKELDGETKLNAHKQAENIGQKQLLEQGSKALASRDMKTVTELAAKAIDPSKVTEQDKLNAVEGLLKEDYKAGVAV